MSEKEIQKGLDVKKVYKEVEEIQKGWNYMRTNLINFLQE